MRFLIDACVGHTLAEWLRGEGHDVAETRDRGRDPGDDLILAWAAEERRVLVTMDKDFGLLIFGRGAEHAGVVRLPHVRTPALLALMSDVLTRYAAALDDGAVITVQETRIRVARPARKPDE